jgi:hypothetical protein
MKVAKDFKALPESSRFTIAVRASRKRGTPVWGYEHSRK